MSKHTAGPWVIIPGDDEWSQGRIATIEPKPETMIETNYWTVAEVNSRRNEREANAFLIAAAPELLEALEGMLENEHQRKFESWLSSKSPSGDCDSVQSQWVESSDYLDFLDSYEDEIKVIAKAKGEAK